MRCALNSYGDVATGIGSEARWLFNLLPFDTWIQAEHNILGYGKDVSGNVARGDQWKAALEDVDAVVCIERCFPSQLCEYAKSKGIKTVVLSNPEWTPRDAWWLQHTDVVVARTDACMAHLKSIGVAGVRLQVPIDLTELPFTPRKQASVAMFSNGWGGVAGRKGLAEVVEMNRLGAKIHILSQRKLDMPHFVEQPSAEFIYNAADIMVCPSRFEGVGLTILEAMASGCLVAATDAPPMSEFIHAAYGGHAWRFLLPVKEVRTVKVWDKPWPAHIIDPVLAVGVLERLRSLVPRVVQEFSVMGREYVEDNHGQAAADKLWEAVTK